MTPLRTRPGHSYPLGATWDGSGVNFALDSRGRPLTDDTLLILVNAHWGPVSFVLPAHKTGLMWDPRLDTREASGRPRRPPLRGGDSYELESRSLVLLRLRGD